jgi:23S rRNA pseudouridine1911/1915/1917 synthase
MATLTVLHEAAGVWAVAKPAGLATQAPPGVPSLEAEARLAVAHPRGSGYLGVPHRLDRAVSGVLLVATTPRAARKLSRQFERRQVRKTYLAVTAQPPIGPPLTMPVEWRDLIAKVPDQPRGRIVEDGTEGRAALTQVWSGGQVELGGEPRFFLRLEPHTGRMHQLRLQAAARGMPVVGDALYGGPPLPPGIAPADDLRAAPILLHAWKIAYVDPDSGQPIEITAPLPEYWPPLPQM